MRLKLIIYTAIIYHQINQFVSEYTVNVDNPLRLNETYELCKFTYDFVCIGLNRLPNDLKSVQEFDCINDKNCLAFLLIRHLKDFEKFEFYLITNDQKVNLIQLNIYHGNSSDHLSIELNCTNFSKNLPVLKMNFEGQHLPFQTIPVFDFSTNILFLNSEHRHCIWSTEENFFINNIFKNKASHLYFDFSRRSYDILLSSRIQSDTKIDNYQSKKVSDVHFVKTDKSNIFFINILLSLNIVFLVTILIAIFIQKGL